MHRTNQDKKKDWLQYSGLNEPPEYREVREWIAGLYDLEHPTDLQAQILALAEEHLEWSEVPGASWLKRRNELIALARKDMLAAPIRTLPAKI